MDIDDELYDSYPDINKREQIVEAICNLEFYGGYTRDWPPGRYIEPLTNFVSFFAIEKAVDIMFDKCHYVNDKDGVIILQDKDTLILEYSDGSEATFRRVNESNQNSSTM